MISLFLGRECHGDRRMRAGAAGWPVDNLLGILEAVKQQDRDIAENRPGVMIGQIACRSVSGLNRKALARFVITGHRDKIQS